MSKELQQFYNELWAWIQAGCPEHRVFQTDKGICLTLDYWGDFNWRLSDELEEQFEDEGYDVCYPFGGMSAYFYEEEHGIIYQNQERLEWIKKHVNILVD